MTPQELRIAVLQELGIVGAGEESNAQPEDVQLVADKYESLHSQLLSKSMAVWGLTEDIPSYAEQPLIWMLAYMLCGAFQINPLRTEELKLKGAVDLPSRLGGPSMAETQLRRQLARDYVPSPATSEYF